MIYRILAATKITIKDDKTGEHITLAGGPLRGGFIAGLVGFDLKYPEVQNPRTRFYFTEEGWREVGRSIVARARREGLPLRVLRRKNPLRSQIVYEDKWQVAILPQKEVARKKRR